MNIWRQNYEEKQYRLRRISEIVHDVMPADCGLDFEGISHFNHQPSQQEKYRTRNGVIGVKQRLYKNPHGERRKLRERESANNTHHPYSKMTGSRPGMSTDQKHVFGVTTHFSQVH